MKNREETHSGSLYQGLMHQSVILLHFSDSLMLLFVLSESLFTYDTILLYTDSCWFRLCDLAPPCGVASGWRNRGAACGSQEGGDKVGGSQSETPEGGQRGLWGQPTWMYILTVLWIQCIWAILFHLLQRTMYSTFHLHASSRLSVKERTWRRELQHWNAGTMLCIWAHSLGDDSDMNVTAALFK